LLASSVDLIGFNIERRLRRNCYALDKKLRRDDAFSLFDYIIIDTPPTFSFLNSLTLPLVDTVYVVAIPEIWSVRAISLYLTALRQRATETVTQFRDIHLIVNRYEKRQKVDADTLEALQHQYAEYYVDPPIPFSNALRNFLLYKDSYKSHFGRVEEPIERIIDRTLGDGA
jgi:cellulose biosynthesis protein BcsQ